MVSLVAGRASQENYVHAIAELINALIKAYEAQVPINLSKIKNEIAKKHKLSYIPKLVDIIAAVPEAYKAKLLPYIKAKPVRTASGVAVVAVMSKPHRCPHIALTGMHTVYTVIPKVHSAALNELFCSFVLNLFQATYASIAREDLVLASL